MPSSAPLNKNSVCAIGRKDSEGSCFYRTELLILADQLKLLKHHHRKSKFTKEELVHLISQKLPGIPQTQWVNTIFKSKANDCFKNFIFKPTLLKKGT